MNRLTATAHLTRDPELVTAPSGTEICSMRIAVKRAGRNNEPGYFELKAFGSQAKACAEYLSKGREVAVDGRLRFEEFETRDGQYASRVYVIADQVEFLTSRRPSEGDDNGQPDPAGQDSQPASVPDSEEAPA
jgi:single-strand DNA-binding protein